MDIKFANIPKYKHDMYSSYSCARSFVREHQFPSSIFRGRLSRSSCPHRLDACLYSHLVSMSIIIKRWSKIQHPRTCTYLITYCREFFISSAELETDKASYGGLEKGSADCALTVYCSCNELQLLLCARNWR